MQRALAADMIYTSGSTLTILRVTIASLLALANKKSVMRLCCRLHNDIGRDVARYPYHLENRFIDTFHYDT